MIQKYFKLLRYSLQIFKFKIYTISLLYEYSHTFPLLPDSEYFRGFRHPLVIHRVLQKADRRKKKVVIMYVSIVQSENSLILIGFP